MKPEDTKPIDVDRLDGTRDAVEPRPAQAAADTRPDAARWLIFVAGAAAIAGIVIVLAFPGANAVAPARTSPIAAAAPVTPAPPAQIESTPPPTWTGARTTTWARDGSKTITFSLAATHDLPVWMNHARPALVVRCLSRTTEAFVALDTSTSYEQDSDRRSVRVQWDDGPPHTQLWGISESGRELFAPNGQEFVRRAATARTLRFGFHPFNAGPVTAEFAVQGFDKLAGLVASTCGWRLTAAS